MHARYVRVGRHALWNLRRARAFRGERMAVQRLSMRRSSIVSHAAVRCVQADVGLAAANWARTLYSSTSGSAMDSCSALRFVFASAPSCAACCCCSLSTSARDRLLISLHQCGHVAVSKSVTTRSPPAREPQHLNGRFRTPRLTRGLYSLNRVL